MGDRANVKILMGDAAPVYLYTHWKGSELLSIVGRALARQQRWDDPAYLARIIFSEMISDNIFGVTGFGIATYMPDNEHAIIVLDPSIQSIHLESETGKPLTDRISFLQFVSANFQILAKDYESISWADARGKTEDV